MNHGAWWLGTPNCVSNKIQIVNGQLIRKENIFFGVTTGVLLTVLLSGNPAGRLPLVHHVNLLINNGLQVLSLLILQYSLY